jgi:hypothetical protein
MGRILDITVKIGLQADLSGGTLMASEVTFSYQDYSREKSNVRFNITTISAATHDAVNTAVNALSTAILTIQNENSLQSKRVISANNFVSRAPAALPETQREVKWLCMFEDTTLHSVFRHEIPQAKASLLAGNSDYLDLSAGDGQAFKTAAEAVVKSPAGNSALLLSVQLVGKRI